MSLDEKGEGDIEITKCLGLLGFAFLVQVLLSNMITVPSIDNETAAAHLQGMYGSFVLHNGGGHSVGTRSKPFAFAQWSTYYLA